MKHGKVSLKSSIQAVFCSLALLNVAGCDAFSSATPQEKVAQALQENNIEQAIFYQKKLVVENPDDAAVRTQLGELYLQNKMIEPARKELEKAILLGNESVAVKRQLISSMFMLRQYSRILALPASYFVDDTEARFYVLASMYNEGEELDDSIKSHFNVCDNTTAACVLGQAVIAQSESRFEVARKLAIKAVQMQSDLSYAQFVLANINTQTGDLLSAIDGLQGYLDLEPWDRMARAYLADLYIKSSEFTKAGTILKELKKEFPDNPLVLYLESYLLFEQEKYDEASTAAELTYSKGVESVSLRLVAGLSAYYTGNYERAYKHLKAIENDLSPTHSAKGIINSLELALGDSLNQQGQSSQDSVVESKLSEATARLANNNDVDKAKMLLQEIIADESIPLSQKFYAGLLEQSFIKDSDNAILRQLSAQNPDYIQPKLALAMSAINNRNFAEAHKFADEIIALSDSPADGLKLHGIAYSRAAEWDKATESFEALIAADPDNVFAYKYFMERATTNRDIEEARKYGRILSNIDVAYIGNWRRFEQAFGDVTIVDDYIKSRFKAKPDDFTLAVYRAQVYNDAEQYGLAVELLDRFNQVSPLPAAYFQQLGYAHIKAGQLEDAVATFVDWQQQSPQNSDAWLKLIVALDLAKQNANALQTASKAITEFPNADVFKTLVVHYNTLLGNFAEGESFINQLSASTLKKSSVQFVIGKFYYRAGKFNDALVWLNKSYEQSPTPSVAMGIASAHMSKNEKVKAVEFLKRYHESVGGTVQTHQMAGLILLGYAPQQAVGEFKSALAKGTTSDNHNNLAFAYLKLSDFTKAMEEVDQALALDSSNTSAKSTKVSVLYQSGKKEKALGLLDEYQQEHPEDEGLATLRQQLTQ